MVHYKNNCFFNAILQALYHSPTFIKCMEENNENHVECVTCCIRETYKEIQCSEKTIFPLKLYNLLKSKIGNLLDGNQQDAHEFFLSLIGIMDVPEHPASSSTLHFQGEVTSTVTCSECKWQSETTTIFRSLQIDILGKPSINDALEKYFSLTNITYGCDFCKQQVNATKKFAIAKAPNSLCLQLIRFPESKKLTDSIQIIKDIDVSQYLTDEHRGKNLKTKYKLVGFVNHLGPELNQGHYTTITTSETSLYEFDDSHVYRIPISDLKSNEAYILFYEAVDLKGPQDSHTLNPIVAQKTCEENGILQNGDVDFEWIPIEIVDSETETEIEIIDCEAEIIDENTQKLHCGGDSKESETNSTAFSINTMEIPINHEADCDVNTLHASDNNYEKMQDFTGLESNKIENDSNYKTVSEENIDKLSGRRIVDINYLFKQMQDMTNNICKTCNSGEMIFEKEFKRGLESIFTFRCTYCEKTVRVNSSHPKSNDCASINESSVLGIVSIGLGYYHLQEFLAHMDITCMSYSTFHKLDTKLQADWWKLAKVLEADALNEEIRLAKENNQVDSAGNALIDTEIDGSWCKRSFGNNFSSLSGCAAIIGRRTNKILYSGVKNKYCHICKIAESKSTTPKIHECKANYVGPSSGMETEIIIDGFKFCNEKGARFNKIIGDGDASTYKALRDLRLYKDPEVDIEKYECENHVYKNFNKKCGTLHTNTKLKLKGRKLLPQSIGKNISKGVRMAAKHWRESDKDPAEKCLNLEKDIMNAPLHYFGVHDGCADYFCDKTTDNEARGAVAVLKETGVYYELLDICQYYLANNAKSLIAGYTTNRTEGYNSLICKTLGGKRVCNSLDGDNYAARTAIADVNFNTKGHSGSAFHNHTFGNTMQTCLKMENTRKRKVASNALSKEINSKKPKLDEKGKKQKVKAKHYGVGHEEVDLTESAFEAAKNRFFERLLENQGNRNALVVETKAQRHSFKWMQVRRNMLTSSYFGRILKANNRKSYSKIIEEIIHKNVQYSNTAELRHQRIYQIEALSIFSQEYNSELISQCGIVIDPEFCFLGASPFRLYGEDGIIVVKCPKKAFNKSIDVALKKNLLPFWTGPLHNRQVNQKSHWYFEIQGQLHITKRRIAYLVIYLGESAHEIVELERNDKFWKKNMEKELLFFYNEGLLKELVDSRYDRGMDLRKYDDEKKTFV